MIPPVMEPLASRVRESVPRGDAGRLGAARRSARWIVLDRSCHPNARRSPALTRSASATRAMKTSSIVITSAPLNIFIEPSINWPNPPAPTKPSTTELRM
eukprot:gene11956-14620_t